ncbi:peptidase U32 family protein [Vibrio tritonius]|uniref:peptidase U32 family protein n=1 Tax=Vibrio tritonius TaxID=1435069 RepID=UPI0008387618|nr:peptidase U32 family protein [Vibrio tritonius]
MSKSQFELLAPGGDLESIKAAIVAGADAIYCGLERFNARNRASNLTLDDLKAILVIAHDHDCKIFLTLNIILLESEIRAVVRLLNQLVHTEIDGVIIQDLGLGYIIKHYFPMLDVHASTQLNTHNEGQVRFLGHLNASRVNVSRELDLPEITRLANFGRQHNMLLEVFVHGSYCIGYSGLCYMSSARNGASGNRGRCSQPCRDTYQKTDVGVSHPLNMKDNSAYEDFAPLADAGVYSLKVEGRMKQSHYVYTVVDQWRKQIDSYEQKGQLLTDTSELYKVFNRDFSAGYLTGTINRDMYIDNPRNHAGEHFAQLAGVSDQEQKRLIKQKVYDDNTQIMAQMQQRIADLDHEVHKDSSRKHKIADIQVPSLKAQNSSNQTNAMQLNVLISDRADVERYHGQEVSVYFALPSALARQLPAILELFEQHPHLIPWFPAVLIGDDFDAAQTLLESLSPALIVTNNTGVATLANQLGLAWVAGPQLNLTNSYALHCLKEEYQCAGAFLSNELSAKQMKHVVRPEQFRLCYSIYQPLVLLTSRQCMFQQTIGCRKKRVTKGCLASCKKSASIINLNGSSYVIDKQRGEHNSIYHQHHNMNVQVVQDLPQLFTDLFIDLRDVPTETKVNLDRETLVALFKQLCEPQSRESASEQLLASVAPTTNAQYIKGLA